MLYLFTQADFDHMTDDERKAILAASSALFRAAKTDWDISPYRISQSVLLPFNYAHMDLLAMHYKVTTMDTPMFKQPENEVTIRFNSLGQIEVILARLLTKEQTRLFINGTMAINGLVDVKAISSIIPADHCGFTFTLVPWEAKNALAHRETIASYARTFAAGLLPEVKQVSLFDTEPEPEAIQVSLF